MNTRTQIIAGIGILTVIGFVATVMPDPPFPGPPSSDQMVAVHPTNPTPELEKVIAPKDVTSPRETYGTEEQRLAFMENDPQMKAAADFVGVLINSNGHLCAQVSNVEPVGNSKFEVTCVERRDGSGRAKYIVNGITNKAVRI